MGRGSNQQAPKQYYYAVRNGRETGIFSNWNECSNQVTGYSNAQFKKFDSPAAANAFVNGGSSSSRSSNTSYGSSSMKSASASSWAPSYSAPSSTSSFAPARSQNAKAIYTDGACRGNQGPDAKAGYGVYFGSNDPRNISQPLKGPKQTNQRAELTAVSKALDYVHHSGYKEPHKIKSDSAYSMDSLQKWGPNWEKNGWVTSTGKPVENRDIIEPAYNKLKAINDNYKERGWGSFAMEHVRGHSGDPGNEAADRLATMAADSNYQSK